jgi:mycothiol synthase
MRPNDLPEIEGITWRRFGDGDYAGMTALLNADLDEGGHDSLTSEDDFVRSFESADRFDPSSDVLIAEAEGRPVGYVATLAWQELAGNEVLFHAGRVDPGWKRRGVGSGLLGWGQDRLLTKSEGVGRRVLRTNAVSPSTTVFMEKHGYEVTQHTAHLVRPDLDDIPELPLPDGIVVRPVTEDDLRAVYEAEVAHFRDHWGASEEEQGWWENFRTNPHMDLSLWQVAFDEDDIVGIVRPYIDAEENDRMDRKRGYTEDISTRSDWRGKGVASALIVRALAAQRDRGMEESALAVHEENRHGAYRLYERHGFQLRSRMDTLDRTVEAAG